MINPVCPLADNPNHSCLDHENRYNYGATIDVDAGWIFFIVFCSVCGLYIVAFVVVASFFY